MNRRDDPMRGLSAAERREINAFAAREDAPVGTFSEQIAAFQGHRRKKRSAQHAELDAGRSAVVGLLADRAEEGIDE